MAHLYRIRRKSIVFFPSIYIFIKILLCYVTYKINVVFLLLKGKLQFIFLFKKQLYLREDSRVVMLRIRSIRTVSVIYFSI